MKKSNRILLLLVLLFIPLWIFSQISVSWILTNIGDKRYDVYSTTLQISEYFGLFVVLIFAPIVEEVVFRGLFLYIYKRLWKPFSFFFGLILVGLFAVMHGTIVHLIPMILLGLYLTVITLYTKNIIWSVAIHFLYNFFCIIFVGISLPSLFFTLEVWLFMVYVVLSILLILYFLLFVDSEQNQSSL